MLELNDKDLERFWSKVDCTQEGGCWTWTAAKSSQGYGRFKLNGKLESPHVISYQLSNKQETKGMDVCHKCDNPSCVNPEHLFLGTRLENCMDCIVKGRANRLYGESHPFVKYSSYTIYTIRSLFSTGLYTKTELARAFGTNRNRIYDIVNFKARVKG